MISLPLQRNIRHRSLHPQLRIKLMQKENRRGHRRPIRLAYPIIKHAFQPKLRNPLFLLNLNTHLKQAIAFPDIGLQRRAATAHDDCFGCFGDDFEVVCYLRADVVGGGFELGGGPELVRGCGVFVFLFEVAALVCVSYCPIISSVIVVKLNLPFCF